MNKDHNPTIVETILSLNLARNITIFILLRNIVIIAPVRKINKHKLVRKTRSPIPQ